MQEAKVSRGKCYVAVGIIGIILSAIYLVLSLQLPMGTMRQPGAGIFPLISGGFVLLGSVATLLEGWKTNPNEQVDVPAGSDLSRFVKILLALVGYIVLLPILGQLISSVLFSFVVMRTLSTLSAIRLSIYSVVIAGAGYWIFVVFFKLPLPSGMLFN